MAEEQQQQQQQQTPPWHKDVEPTILGHWQNKGYDLSDPGKVAIEATKAAIAAAAHVGAPPERLIRLPEKPDDAAGWNGVWTKLGRPEKPDGYDLKDIKRANGADLEPALADTLRGALHAANVSKDAAPGVVKAVLKHQDDTAAAAAAEATARKNEQIGNLKKSWGTNQALNEATALAGANRLGISQEEYNKIASVLGYDRAPEIFRKIGAGTREDTFQEGNQGGGGNPVTAEAASARLTELTNDTAWSKRLTDGDANAVREFNNLTGIIAAAA